MSKTLIDVDEVALAIAMAHYGTSEKRDAVNRALRDVAHRRSEQATDLDAWIAEVGARLAAAYSHAARAG